MMDAESPQLDQLNTMLHQHNQAHVLRHWDQLEEDEKQRLLRQLQGIDLDEITALHASFEGESSEDWAALARRAQPPRAVRPNRPAAAYAANFDANEAQKLGKKALSAGQVGVLLVAGGQGSRLGFDKPKGMYPVGPVSGATLFQMHCEKLLATARRYGVRVPLYLMTSPATHEETIEFLNEHDRFGLAAADVIVFCQGTMPAVDAKTGKLLLADKGELFMNPDGHGGTIAALATSGAMDDIVRRGLKHLFFFQVDNPLTPICDPEWIGYHTLAESELTSVAVAKEAPMDRVGNFVSIDGRVQVIEYIDFPEEVASERESDGTLKFWAGNTAIHVFDVAFIKRVLGLADALPFHIQHKKVPYLDDNDEFVEPNKPNALKFERFIFDLLPQARNAIVVEAPEKDVFAPLKNASGAPRDTPEFVNERMVALHRRWLREAGADVAEGINVEISPLFALDVQQLKQRIEPGTTVGRDRYFTL